ncbi:MAG TPA: LLM class F420-dependent oxidoreductase [Candidatus Binataceae bacterium]|nr:LLM class F420-dependent oxidoreductase [Candidatus Binataceae bacterium]
MKIGLMFINAGPFGNPELLAHLATTAERCGFESMWTVEHVVVPQDYKSAYPYSSSGKMPGGEDTPIPDPVLPLAYIAGITKKIRLGTGVMILPQRHPLYVAKEMATLDVLSGGRAMLGIGSGWLQEEFAALGIDFHTRGARTDEAIKSLRSLWREDASAFHGKHFNFGPVKSYPKPLQKGGVPIHVGGHSEAAARRAGRLGDGFFPARGEPDKLKELFATMKAEAKKAGRNPDSIELSCGGAPQLDYIKMLADLGVSRVIVAPPGFDPQSLTVGLEKIGNEIIAKL